MKIATHYSPCDSFLRFLVHWSDGVSLEGAGQGGGVHGGVVSPAGVAVGGQEPVGAEPVAAVVGVVRLLQLRAHRTLLSRLAQLRTRLAQVAR